VHAQVIMHVFDDAVPIDQPFKLGSENLVVHQEWYAVSEGHPLESFRPIDQALGRKKIDVKQCQKSLIHGM
jgi:hypothetical protein